MKKSVAIIFISCIAAIASCKKDSSNSGEISVAGSWHLYAFGPPTSFPQKPADDNILVFEQSGKYSRKTNNILQENGSYNLLVNPTLNNDTVINFLPADTNSYKQIMHLQNDTLVLVPLVFTTDGYAFAYSRQ